ncbi:PACE efflux transporter [Falsigemmobacter faecalis]|uniref:PACE efflux transporter n=1 Tax=Falsigemmobacter faecalis TaxID=2488730 RepID=A0A3P3DD51_9RHOB|nr:PACE efflux transporter [Falsigemmobacter faecalis]RRH72191.1 PACE efflux transporter [Falsigemmobacter faecalis]
MFRLPATQRRLVYVALFESLAIVLSTLLLNLLSKDDSHSSLPVAVAVSVIAVVWNFVFNTGFEAAERRFGITHRSLLVRVVHAAGFEGGLVLFTVPLFMLWYQVGVIDALVMEAAILVFFLVFTFVFTLAFDRVFPLPHQQVQVQDA